MIQSLQMKIKHLLLMQSMLCVILAHNGKAASKSVNTQELCDVMPQKLFKIDYEMRPSVKINETFTLDLSITHLVSFKEVLVELLPSADAQLDKEYQRTSIENAVKNTTNSISIKMTFRKSGFQDLSVRITGTTDDGHEFIQRERISFNVSDVGVTTGTEAINSYKDAISKFNEEQVLEFTKLDCESDITGELSPTATLSGYLYYRNQLGTGSLPIRYATVEMWEETWPFHTLRQTTFTSATGYFNFTAAATNKVYIKFYCRTEAVKVQLCVLLICNDYWGQSESVSPGSSITLIVTDDNRAVFYMYDNVIDEYQWIQDRTGWNRSQIAVQWPSGSWPQYSPLLDAIQIPKDGYVWEWDRGTLLHEYGHGVMAGVYGRFSMPGGCNVNPHSINSESCEGFAFTEGWAEFMECAVDESPYKLDKYSYCTYEWEDLETNNFWWGDDCDSTDNSGSIVEGAVASILWDIFDQGGYGQPGDDDNLNMGYNNGSGSIWYIFKNDKPASINSFWDYWFSKPYNYGQQMWAIYYDHGINKDNSPPSNPTYANSTCAINQWCKNSTFQACWNSPSDNMSGIDGYSGLWDNSSNTTPDIIKDQEETRSCSTKTLSDGVWYYHVRAVDNAKNWGSTSHFGPFKIDATLPSIVDNQQGDDIWRSTGGVLYDIDFTDNQSYLSYVQYKVTSQAGQGGNVLKDWTNIATGINASSYTTNWTVDFSACQEGYNYVSTRAYDYAGNVRVSNDVFYVKKDTQQPVVTDNQSGDDTWRNNPGAQYDVDFQDLGSLLSSCQYKITSSLNQGGQVLKDWTNIAVGISAPTFSQNWPVDFPACQQGINYVSVKVVDNFGRETVRNDVFYIKKDTQLPAIADNQLGDDQWKTTSGAIYNVDFFDNGSLLSNAQYKITSQPNQNGTVFKDWTNIATGINSSAYTLDWGVDFQACQEGYNYVSVRANDNAGNSQTLNDAFYVKKDSQNPTIVDNQTGDDAWRAAGGSLYNVDFYDYGSLLSNVRYKITSAPGQGGLVLKDWTDIATGINSDSYTQDWLIDFNSCQEGFNYVSARAWDNVNNDYTLDDVFYLKKDVTGPTDGTISINGGSTECYSVIVTLDNLNASDLLSGMGSGAKMRISNNGSQWSTAEDFNATRQNWDLSGYGGNSTPGEKVVYVQFQDAAGNWSNSFSDSINYVQLSDRSTWYVSVAADGLIDGSEAHPLPSIVLATSLATDRDTIIVLPGIYSESISIENKTLTMMSKYGPSSTILNGDGIRNLVTIRGPRVMSVALEKLTFTTPAFRCVYDSLSTLLIKDCVFFLNADEALNCVACSLEFLGNLIVESNPAPIGTVVLANASARIVNNTLHNTGQGIYSDGSRGVIENNIFTNNFAAIAVENPVTSDQPYIDYNDFWNNYNNYLWDAVPGPHDIYLDPQYVGGNPFDYRLQLSSPCIDAGDPVLGIDEDGTTLDLGALPVFKGRTKYVDVDGDEMIGNGSPSRPYFSINRAVKASVFGDSIIVHPGTYYETDTLKSGLTLLSKKGPDSTKISTVDSSSYLAVTICCDTCDYLHIEGFTITPGYPQPYIPNRTVQGINLQNCDHLVFKNNRVWGNASLWGPSGAILVGDSMLIYGNSIAGNRLVHPDWLVESSSKGDLSSLESGATALSTVNTILIGESGVGMYISGTGNVIDSNDFTQNYLDSDRSFNGVGLSCVGSENRISRNNFETNSSIFRGGCGGGLYLDSKKSLVENNKFDGNHTWTIWAECKGAGLYLKSDSCEITDNTFVGNRINGNSGLLVAGAGIYVEGKEARIHKNELKRNVILGMNTIAKGGGVYSSGVGLEFAENYLAFDSLTGSMPVSGGGICSEGDSASILRNTFYSNYVLGTYGSPYTPHTVLGGGIFVSGTEAKLSNNIITKNRVYRPCYDTLTCPGITSEGGGVAGTSTTQLDCNNIFLNYADSITSNYYACSPGPNDFSENPRFCNPDSLDFQLYDYSPCTGDSMCGKVGALDVGCYGGPELAILVFSPVDVTVLDPVGDSLSKTTATIFASSYSEIDLDNDGDLEDSLYIPHSLDGGYKIIVQLDTSNHTGDTLYSLAYRIGGGPLQYVVNNAAVPSVGELDTLLLQSESCIAIPGDANSSGNHSLGDIIATVNYVFNKPGCSPQPICWLSGLLCRGDWNASGTITLGDIIWGINYIFNKPGGPWTPLASEVCCQPVP